MMLKVLEYAVAILPIFFKALRFAAGNTALNLIPGLEYDENLFHKKDVEDYICTIKELSEFDNVINEFKQIGELFDVVVTQAKVFILIYISWAEEEARKYCPNGISHDDFLIKHEENVQYIRDTANNIAKNYSIYSNRNEELLKIALTKRSELTWKKGVLIGLYNDNCVIF